MRSILAIQALLSLAVFVLAAGTVFFHYVEGWAWIDAYFFSVVTVTTVGMGPAPVTTLGKLGATLLIFIGIGIFAVLISHIGRVITAEEMKRMRRNGRAQKIEEAVEKITHRNH